MTPLHQSTRLAYMASKQREIRYFCAGSQDQAFFGHVWRLWAHGTSFYLSARAPELADMKYSLHGPDPRPGMTPAFKLGWARPVAGRSALGSGVLPMLFPGGPVAPGVRHVLRFRFRPDLYDGTVPNGVGVGDVHSRPALRIPLPAPGEVADLDFYVADDAPYLLPGASEQNAVVGPISNDAGQWLTGVMRRRVELCTPTPTQAFAMPPLDAADAIRGVWTGNGGCAFAWVVEARMSRRTYLERMSEPPPWLSGRTLEAPRSCRTAPPWGWTT